MAELSYLDACRRASTSRRFGPKTLHGRDVIYRDEQIIALAPLQRVERVLSAQWQAISVISARADIDEAQARILCKRLVALGTVEKLPHEKSTRPALYRLAASRSEKPAA